ncbi:heme-binding domain-containing protein [Aggregatilinea lenta]|uniref:heme-binding domain-containing protein n=1 Tax=Aggregatilinea lenta TaxID=913108 RepID=UPI001EE993B4|nr:heme-binding domain-containing protein [Aggregatilinea lenta]
MSVRSLFRLPTHPDRRWWTRTLLIDAGIVLVVLGAIQLVPIKRDNPPVVREPNWDSTDTRDLVVQACYDCHSSETEWPWYAHVAPVSWVLRYDVTEGREALDFSDWDRQLAMEPDPDEPFAPDPLDQRIEDEIRSGSMPPTTYRLLHEEARLTDAEKDALIEGLRQTIAQSSEAGE